MDIIVVLKQTFDTEERISMEQGQISEENVEFIINPYDEYAVEEAIRLRDQFGGEVTLITVGPSRTETALRTGLALGADKAVMVEDDSVEKDEFAISKILSAVIKDRPYDIILIGNMSVDNGAGQVGPRLAEELNIPHISSITKLAIEGSTATIIRDVEGDTETVEAPLPLLVTCQQGLNEPRYPSLPGIMKAKKKPLERLCIEDLELNPEQIQSKTAIISQYLPPKKAAGRILSGELGNQVKELVQLLRGEAKVI